MIKTRLEKVMGYGMLLVISLSSLFVNIDLKSIQASKKTQKQEYKYTAVVDAGHGGYDPGKVGINEKLEKDINLSIALKLKEYLEKENVKVIIARTEDISLCDENAFGGKKTSDMRKRVEIVNNSKADLCISIHQNSYNSKNVKGAQVFYYSKSENGKKFAEVLQEIIKSDVDVNNKRMAKANDSYYMLLKVECTAAIIECGFLSNWEEATALDDQFYQDKIAAAINKAVIKYLSNI